MDQSSTSTASYFEAAKRQSVRMKSTTRIILGLEQITSNYLEPHQSATTAKGERKWE